MSASEPVPPGHDLAEGTDVPKPNTTEGTNTVTSQDNDLSCGEDGGGDNAAESSPIKREDVIPNFDSMVQYFRAMEERIQSLELQVAKLSGSTTQRGEKAVVMPGPNRQSLGSPAKAWILRLTEDEFEGPSPKGEPVHVIELLDDDDGALKKIRIRSEQLLKTLRDVMGPSIIPDISRSMVMTRPFKVLLSFEQELRLKKAEVEQETEDQAFHDSNEYPEATAEPTKPGNLAESGKNASKTDLDVLIEVLTYDLAEDSAAYRYTRTRSEELVTFPQLWYLFQPGDTVVDGRGSSVQAYRVLSVHEKIPRDGETVAEALPDMTSVVSIRCIYIGFNGTMFGPVGKTFTIGYFHGKRSITSLPIVPIDFHKGFDMAKLLVDRGSSFRLFSTSRHAAYQGMTMDKELPTELDGEVMVDTNLYYRDHPDLIPPDFATAITDEEASIIHDDDKLDSYLTERFLKSNAQLFRLSSYQSTNDKDSGPLSDEQLMLLPSFVWGFYLRGRKWHALDVKSLSSVTYPRDAFESLVLPAESKSLLSSLVTSHIMPRSVKEAYHPESDLVVGKGKGLIMLFHGPPGLGKTSTAECLAAYAHKPLFPITAADIGTTPQEVEMSLQTIFGLSQRWECILLFDEADIILQARDRDNFGRNAIVTVFLRTLEYYSGILIMTTNRVGIVDEAFKSRIHVTLYFPKLDLESFLMIWQTALQRLRYDKDIDIDEKRIMRFAREVWKRSKDHPMNGRDIQNTIQSAVALAEFDAKNGGGRVTLAPQHIDPVLKMSDDFNKYLTAVHGVSDSEQARLSGDRDDEADWESSTFLDEASSVPLYTTSRRALGPNDPDRDSGYRSSSRWYE